jgi:hypothetical protein
MHQLPHPGPPDTLPLPVPESVAAKVAAEPAPCEAVTREELQNLLDAIAGALMKAEANVAVNGVDVPEAVYPVAANYGRDYVLDARNHAARMLAIADEYDVPPGLVRYPAISYNIYGICRHVVFQLHVARHWEAISAIYNHNRGTAAPAVACVNPITTAIKLAEPLSSNATGCYLAAYGL